MKLFETSVLELLLKPLKLLPWIKEESIRECYNYEHVYAPLVYSILPIWLFLIAAFLHIVVKEAVDVFGSKKQPWKQTKIDLTTRSYGVILAFIFKGALHGIH